MEILVFGNSGFIGKNLISHLQDEYDIQGISLRDTQWKTKIKSSQVFINLIGKAHDHAKSATEEDYRFANVVLTKQIFDAFIFSEAKLLIHISSIAAVEEFESLIPLRETDECRPFSSYGKSKREAEEWLLAQLLPENKKFIILRPPMVHGPGDKGNLALLYKFISKGIPYPLASFNNSRSFISVNNFSFFIQEIIKKYEQIPSGIYHIADDEPVSTNRLVQLIGQATEKEVKLWKIPEKLISFAAKTGDFLSLPLNTERLKKLTESYLVSNIKVKTALHIEKLPVSAEEGLLRTLKSFKK